MAEQDKFVRVDDGYYPQSFLDAVWRELQRKAPIWQACLEVPSQADRLAYEVLKNNATFRPTAPLDPHQTI